MSKSNISVNKAKQKTEVRIRTSEPGLMDYLWWDAANEFYGMRRPDVHYNSRTGRYSYGIAFTRLQAGCDGHIYANARPHRKPTSVEAVFMYDGRMPKRVQSILEETLSKTKSSSIKSTINQLLS